MTEGSAGEEPRFYRRWVGCRDLTGFTVKHGETDMFVLADRDLGRETAEITARLRREIEEYIETSERFAVSLSPVSPDPGAPAIIRDMIEKSAMAGVGPMAGVAGAMAGYTAKELLNQSCEVIIENGGDIFMVSRKTRNLAVYAGASPLSGKISLRIRPESTPLGICTSSGTVGHSISFGSADAACAISEDAVLADCAATGMGNLVKDPSSLKDAINYARSIDGLRGALVIFRDKLATWGDVELI